MNTKIITLDINKKIFEPIIAKQGDTNSRFLLFNLYDNSVAFNLTGRSVRAYAVKPDGTKIYNDLVINDAAKGICTLELTTQMLAVEGFVNMELVITEGTKKLSSIPFVLSVIASLNADDAVISTNEFTVLQEALAQVQNIDNRFSEVNASLDNIPNKKLNLLLKKYENYDDLANKSISILGDSISYGAIASDFFNNTYAQILKRSVYGRYKDNNYGFVNFIERTQNNNNAFAKINSANFTFVSDGSEHFHVGDTLMKSVVASANIAYNFKKYFSKFRVGYKQQVGGGSFRVAYKRYDGQYITINTFSTDGTLDYNKITSEISIPTDIHIDMSISIITTNSNPVEIYGVWCYEDSTSLMVNNYSKPGARLYQIENTVINRMSEANFLIFALGHNDWAVIDEGGDSSLKTLFSQKINLIINNVNNNNIPILIMDFVWSKNINESFVKQELRRLYESCNNSYYIDAMLYIRKDRNINKAIEEGFFIDVSHPSDKGHELITEMICNTLNISVVKKSSELTIGVENTDIILQNGVTNGSMNLFTTIGKVKVENGIVRLFMNLDNLQHNVVAFNLPVGYRPKMTIKFLVEGYVGSTNNALTYMTISSSGDVKFLLTSVNTYQITAVTTEISYMI